MICHLQTDKKTRFAVAVTDEEKIQAVNIQLSFIQCAHFRNVQIFSNGLSLLY